MRADATARIDEFVETLGPLADAAPGACAACAVDGVEPRAVAFPASTEDLSRVMSEAHRCRLAIIPLGAGRHAALGNTPAAYDLAVSLSRMDRILDHEPADLTVTVEAGVSLAALDAALAAHRQFLPLDPPPDAGATLGGVVAANAQGALRHAFGTARDWLIGIEVVQADGTLVKAGGRVVKNVAGYDMTKLYVGSLGTLGVIARATFKVAPRAAAGATLAVTCQSAHAAGILLLSAHDAGLALHAGEALSPRAAAAVVGASRWTALLRVAGGERAVGRTVRELSELAGGLGAAVDERDGGATWDAWRSAFAPRDLSLRLSVAPSAVPDVLDTIESQLQEFEPAASATLSAGLIRVNLRADRAAYERACEIVRAHGGSVVVDAAPPALKRAVDVFGPARGDFAIMRRLKAELDPAGTLAPGRFVSRL